MHPSLAGPCRALPGLAVATSPLQFSDGFHLVALVTRSSVQGLRASWWSWMHPCFNTLPHQLFLLGGLLAQPSTHFCPKNEPQRFSVGGKGEGPQCTFFVQGTIRSHQETRSEYMDRVRGDCPFRSASQQLHPVTAWGLDLVTDLPRHGTVGLRASLLSVWIKWTNLVELTKKTFSDNHHSNKSVSPSGAYVWSGN